MSLRCVIFDFDGIILDTELPEFTAWCEIYESHGQTLGHDKWSLAIGTRNGFDPYAHLETLSGAQIDRPATRALHSKRSRELISALELLDGVETRLDEAKALGLRIGMASSSDRGWIEEHLGRFGLTSRFDVIRCCSDGLPAKPNPALYVAAVRDLGCEPREAAAFEDSPNGIAAAKAAGVYCIAVPNEMTSVLDLSAADLIVPSLAEVSLARISSGWNRLVDSEGSLDRVGEA
jgi:HAD superfamily hydrolase (TIGR01509 family)